MNDCLVIPLGLVDYERAYNVQRRLHAQVVDGVLPDLLLLLEHPHVYTLGRRGKEADVLASPQTLRRLGVDVRHTDRGGETTYHGPGQLVGYPIVHLRRRRFGVRDYVCALEASLVRALAGYAIEGVIEGKPVGVWVGDAKIAAIGVRVSRGVTMHGFALNVCPDLRYFDHIVPCGMEDGRVTCMAQELAGKQAQCATSRISVTDVMPNVVQAFAAEFGMRMVRADALGDTAALLTN